MFMVFIALAITLGHDLIGHHHHDFEYGALSHYHEEGHHNCSGSDNESDGSVLEFFFSGLQHGMDGLVFITCHNSSDNFSKDLDQFTSPFITSIVVQHINIDERQKRTLQVIDCCNSQRFLPSGLRAPPVSIV